MRLRLTALYGALFLISGAGLLVITFIFVSHASADNYFVSTKNGVTIAGFSIGTPPPVALPGKSLRASGSVSRGGVVTRGPMQQPAGGASGSVAIQGPGIAGKNPLGLTSKQIQEQQRQFVELAAAYRNSALHTLLTESGIALAIMALLSIFLGWLVAGRVLRPLRTISSAARHISATNLHERLALAGPDDELKELADTFDALLERLDRAFSSQRQFVANASHELRTPLARQRAIVQVALSDPGASADSLRAAHERVLASGEQQEQLIEALLTLSRSQLAAECHDAVDLAATTGHLVAVKAVDAELSGLRMTADLASANVHGNPRLLERLIANLLDNAIRYNIEHGVIEVLTGVREDRPYLLVVNDGPVVPSDQVERLLQPFQRLNGERVNRGEGFGLGLSIVKAIVDAHGAVLRVSPRVGGGLSIEVGFSPQDSLVDSEPGGASAMTVPAADPVPAGGAAPTFSDA